MFAQLNQLHRVRRQYPAWLLGLAVVTVGLVALAVHAHRFYPFVADDALISLRYAARLIAGKGLTWNDGERVEGYSNLLWILCCAGLGGLGVGLIDATRVLGVACMTAVFLALCYRHRSRSLVGLLPSVGGCLLLAFSGPVAVWTIGGLEQPLVAALLAWVIVTSLPLVDQPTAPWRAFRLPGLLFGLLAVTRPDGGLFAATAALALVLVGRLRRAAWRNAAALMAIPLLFVGGQLAFRLLYYRDWIPNTAYAKVAPSVTHLWDGLAYVRMGVVYLRGALIAAAAGGIVCACVPALRKRGLLLALLIGMWAAYVVAIGGDIFNGRRHFVPILVVSALLVAEGAAWLVQAQRRWIPATAWGFLVVCLAVLLGDQRQDPKNLAAVREHYEWDAGVIGVLLRDAFAPQQPLLAVEAAGALPYFSELPALDLYGLNDRYLAHHRPVDFGRRWIGHELGDGRYALGREPDLIVFCWSAGNPKACSRSGKEMQANPRFAREYALVLFEGLTPYPFDSIIYVRIDSRRIGVRRDGSTVMVPAYLFSDGRLPVRLDAEGRPELLVPPMMAGRLEALDLPAGEWRLRSVPGQTHRVWMWSHDGHHELQAEQAVRGSLDIEIRPLGWDTQVSEIVFERVSDAGGGGALTDEPPH